MTAPKFLRNFDRFDIAILAFLALSYLVVFQLPFAVPFIHRADFASYWILWAPHFALLIFHALIYAEPRYLFPSLPGLTIMASIGWLAVSQKAPFLSESVEGIRSWSGLSSKSRVVSYT
jgi:hypothetical protein